MFNKIKLWWEFDGRYYPQYIKYGIRNLIRWFRIIWKDRDWDQAYIWDILEKKLRHQSHYIKHHGHHVNTDYDARNMLICANLIKKIRDEFYDGEYMDYYSWKVSFVPSDREGLYEMTSKTKWEKFDDYFKKYPRIHKEVLSKCDPERKGDKKWIAMQIGVINHKRARKLLFKIMENNIDTWWD